jgi:hypothetical protein
VFAYQATTSQGRTATDEFQEGYSISGGVDFLGFFKSNFTNSQTLTWTNKWSSSHSTTSGTSATFSITGPADCKYAGKTDVQVYQDNVYGTFMFSFIN